MTQNFVWLRYHKYGWSPFCLWMVEASELRLLSRDTCSICFDRWSARYGWISNGLALFTNFIWYSLHLASPSLPLHSSHWGANISLNLSRISSERWSRSISLVESRGERLSVSSEVARFFCNSVEISCAEIFCSKDESTFFSASKDTEPRVTLNSFANFRGWNRTVPITRTLLKTSSWTEKFTSRTTN